jgi:hypothetical protein
MRSLSSFKILLAYQEQRRRDEKNVTALAPSCILYPLESGTNGARNGPQSLNLTASPLATPDARGRAVEFLSSGVRNL